MGGPQQSRSKNGLMLSSSMTWGTPTSSESVILVDRKKTRLCLNDLSYAMRVQQIRVMMRWMSLRSSKLFWKYFQFRYVYIVHHSSSRPTVDNYEDIWSNRTSLLQQSVYQQHLSCWSQWYPNINDFCISYYQFIASNMSLPTVYFQLNLWGLGSQLRGMEEQLGPKAQIFDLATVCQGRFFERMIWCRKIRSYLDYP